MRHSLLRNPAGKPDSEGCCLWKFIPSMLVFALSLLAACTPARPVDIPTARDSQAVQSTPASAGASPAPVDAADAALLYSQCVRDNGYPEFPDPGPGGGIMLRRDQGMSFNDPRMLAAMEACQDLRPAGMAGGGQSEEAMELLLEFAQCMRDNGVPEFPDPSPGGGRMVIGSDSGINPNSPTFRSAASICMAEFQGGMMFGGSR